MLTDFPPADAPAWTARLAGGGSGDQLTSGEQGHRTRAREKPVPQRRSPSGLNPLPARSSQQIPLPQGGEDAAKLPWGGQEGCVGRPKLSHLQGLSALPRPAVSSFWHRLRRKPLRTTTPQPCPYPQQPTPRPYHSWVTCPTHPLAAHCLICLFPEYHAQ